MTTNKNKNKTKQNKTKQNKTKQNKTKKINKCIPNAAAPAVTGVAIDVPSRGKAALALNNNRVTINEEKYQNLTKQKQNKYLENIESFEYYHQKEQTQLILLELKYQV